MAAVQLADLNVFEQVATLGHLVYVQQHKIDELVNERDILRQMLGETRAKLQEVGEAWGEEREATVAYIAELRAQLKTAEPDGQAPGCNPGEAGSTPVAVSKTYY